MRDRRDASAVGLVLDLARASSGAIAATDCLVGGNLRSGTGRSGAHALA